VVQAGPRDKVDTPREQLSPPSRTKPSGTQGGLVVDGRIERMQSQTLYWFTISALRCAVT
jgi:hypothetical protein